MKTARAYRIKLALQDIYNSGMDKIDAMNALQKWLCWASRSRLPHIKAVASIIKKNWNGIINYFHSNITNGLLEGINSLIQSAKARARGFKNVGNFKAIIYFIEKGCVPISPEVFFDKCTSQIKVGRNDKCPCGSGGKYKNCCGK